MSGLRLRRADPQDCLFVWETNNEAGVRAQSVRRDPIPLEVHERWFAEKLTSADSAIWIAEVDGRVGVVRCDRRASGAEMSLAVAKDARGRGFGTQMIVKAAADSLDALDVRRVTAVVRPDNDASRRAFERAGFQRIGAETRDTIELLVYEWIPR